MESVPLVAVYESRLWRRSWIAEALMGISFERELERITRAARLEQAGRLLDLACGSAIYSRPFARRMSKGETVSALSPELASISCGFYIKDVLRRSRDFEVGT
jgi:hypothetical protein